MDLHIKIERISREWTLDYVAQYVGITNQAVSLIETGQRKPSYAVMGKLEELFGMGHRELLKPVTTQEVQEND